MDSEFLLGDSGFSLVNSNSQMISHLYIRISNCAEYLNKKQSDKNSTKEDIAIVILTDLCNSVINIGQNIVHVLSNLKQIVMSNFNQCSFTLPC